MEPLRRQLWKLTIPIFVEVALVMLVFLVFQFTSIGVGIVCAQYHGAGLRQRLVWVVITYFVNRISTDALTTRTYAVHSLISATGREDFGCADGTGVRSGHPLSDSRADRAGILQRNIWLNMDRRRRGFENTMDGLLREGRFAIMRSVRAG